MKILTIKKSSEFQSIGKKGNKFHAKSLLLLQNPTSEIYFCDKNKGKNAIEFCRVGYTVSKRVGNAVRRNLAKRRLRQAARALFPALAKNHHDYIIIAKPEIDKVDYVQIEKDLQFCLKRIGVKMPVKTTSDAIKN